MSVIAQQDQHESLEMRSSTIDLTLPPQASRRRWGNPALYWPSLTAATAHLDAPLAVLEQPASAPVAKLA